LVEGGVSVMVNEEDHLRLHGMRSGFALEEAYAEVEAVDADLGRLLPFAFHPEFGYLTSCPTNAGTGLRASVLIHLPGLVLTKEIGKVLQGLAQVGLTFRGLYGEGSEVVGNFFQLSNQTTLGKSEDELLDHLGKIVRQVIEYEEQARDVLLRTAPDEVADKTWRAYGLLKYARKLTFEETMNLLSGVRLGVGLNLIPSLSVYTLNKLLIFTQPAHLAALEGRQGGDPELPTAPATYVRHMLEADAAGAAATDLPYTSRAKKVLELAMSEARELNHSYVGTEHLLLGLLREEKGIAAQVLTDAGVNLEQARAETLRLLGSEMPSGPAPSGSGAQPASPKSEKKSKTPALDHFCRDLTQLAAEGQLDPTIGRQKEIERVMEILSRRKKNNPVLIGEPGVGKTAIVEGLAQLIASGQC